MMLPWYSNHTLATRLDTVEAVYKTVKVQLYLYCGWHRVYAVEGVYETGEGRVINNTAIIQEVSEEQHHISIRVGECSMETWFQESKQVFVFAQATITAQ